MTNNTTNLIWLDLEMTGLEVAHDKILEIATVVTDATLNIIAEGPVFAINQAELILSRMDNWNRKQHQASGLLTRVKLSTTKEKTAEAATLEFLAHHVPYGVSPLCGNSVWQDRRFLAEYMPELERYFHYRLIDVSTLKELARRWQPQLYAGFKKKSAHLALDDIKESIAELRYYREQLFKVP